MQGVSNPYSSHAIHCNSYVRSGYQGPPSRTVLVSAFPNRLGVVVMGRLYVQKQMGCLQLWVLSFAQIERCIPVLQPMLFPMHMQPSMIHAWLATDIQVHFCPRTTIGLHQTVSGLSVDGG